MRTYYITILFALVALFSCTSHRALVAPETMPDEDVATYDGSTLDSLYELIDRGDYAQNREEIAQALREVQEAIDGFDFDGEAQTDEGESNIQGGQPVEGLADELLPAHREVADATRVATDDPDALVAGAQSHGAPKRATAGGNTAETGTGAMVDATGTNTDSLATSAAPFDTKDRVAAMTDSVLAHLTDSAVLAASQHAIAQRKDTTIAVHYDANEGKQEADTVSTRSSIDSPVEYTATDSLVYDAVSGSVYLYGDAKVHYQHMDLGAERIVMNMDSSLVRAVGVTDTLGTTTGTPVYKQGNEEYESETMKFNFKTKQGYITDVRTEQGEGYLQSAEAKRTDDGMFYVQNAKYTTCDADHPHFYLKLTKGKIHPGKETFFGPAYLVVEDVPLPLAVPYGFFPFNKSYSSGIIMPTYGDENSRGFYLREGGYYFALSDKMDLTLLGEIYTKGSWGVSAETQYAKRYKFRGNAMISYQNTVNGERNLPDYQK